MIKVIIAGGRELSDYHYLCKIMDNILRLRTLDEVIIICGMAKGADLLGLRYAKERGYSWLEFPADWDKYKKAAGYRRNVEMAEASTHLVAFWDGKSVGTKHMIDIANREGLVVKVVTY
jgi:hypothetical protein